MQVRKLGMSNVLKHGRAMHQHLSIGCMGTPRTARTSSASSSEGPTPRSNFDAGDGGGADPDQTASVLPAAHAGGAGGVQTKAASGAAWAGIRRASQVVSTLSDASPQKKSAGAGVGFGAAAGAAAAAGLQREVKAIADAQKELQRELVEAQQQARAEDRTTIIHARHIVLST